jgi:hypothetical protein
MATTISNQKGDQNFVPGQPKFRWSITDSKGNSIYNIKHESLTWEVSLNQNSKFYIDSEEFIVDKHDIVNTIIKSFQVKLVSISQHETITVLKFNQVDKP